MSYLELLLKSLENENIEIIIEDEGLFNRSILESRRCMYQEHCDVLGIPNDKDPDSFYNLYSEWPLPDGRWSIHKFDGSERFTIQRKDKKSVTCRSAYKMYTRSQNLRNTCLRSIIIKDTSKNKAIRFLLAWFF